MLVAACRYVSRPGNGQCGTVVYSRLGGRDFSVGSERWPCGCQFKTKSFTEPTSPALRPCLASGQAPQRGRQPAERVPGNGPAEAPPTGTLPAHFTSTPPVVGVQQAHHQARSPLLRQGGGQRLTRFRSIPGRTVAGTITLPQTAFTIVMRSGFPRRPPSLAGLPVVSVLTVHRVYDHPLTSPCPLGEIRKEPQC